MAQVYANSITEGWWGGSAFGARRFAGCALAFAVGLAAMIEWGRSRPLAAISSILAPFLLLNVWLMTDVRRGRISLAGGLPVPALLQPVVDRLGNPFSLPASLAFAWEHKVWPGRYDPLGEQTFNTLSLDIGAAADADFLTYGWSTPESQADFTYRWTIGSAAGVAIPIARRADYLVEFRAQPYRPDSAAAPSTMAIVMNGRFVERLTLMPDLSDYRVLIPIEMFRPNLNHLRFEFSSATSPKSIGVSDDPRELAVRFVTLTITRQ